jgi:hypothetical protein
LCLLILLAFVIRSMGFEKDNIPLHADIVFSVASVVGACDCLGEPMIVLTGIADGYRGDCIAVGHVVKPTHTLILWIASTGLGAILAFTVVLLWQLFRSGPVTVMRIQGAMFHSRPVRTSSFGMLTTVGYAGITPVTPLALPDGRGVNICKLTEE